MSHVLFIAFSSRRISIRVDQRNVDHVLGQEPYLELVRAYDVADEKVVRSVVSVLGRLPRHRPRLEQYHLVRVEKAGNLYGDFLTPADGARYYRRFSESWAIARLIPPKS